MDTHTQRIRTLNNELRQKLTGGLAVMTPGIAALGPEAVERIVKNNRRVRRLLSRQRPA